MLQLTIVLKRLGKSFIEGFINSMANEKDPHNLMLAFSIMKVILIEFDVVGLQEVCLPNSGNKIDGRNYLTRFSVISRLPSRRDPMMSTASRQMI